MMFVRVARKPLLSRKNRAKVRNVASEHIAIRYSNIVYVAIDRISGEMFGNNVQCHSWRKAHHNISAKHLLPTVKHGGGV